MTAVLYAYFFSLLLAHFLKLSEKKLFLVIFFLKITSAITLGSKASGREGLYNEKPGNTLDLFAETV